MKEIKVKILNEKDIDTDDFMSVKELQSMREQSIKRLMNDFERLLLSEAIRIKSKTIYMVHYSENNETLDCQRIDTYYKSFDSKEAAEKYLEKVKKFDFYSSMCDYHFDKLLAMSDIEFDEIPDLGCKDLMREYREVMRDK